ncbi:MAG: glycosyltransferase family 2 protein [Leptospiraceae bacterium]|nr:glycosyltransferase family 2 protein [Leptospiraceae bacterium]MDW7975267.1 glycosyltransferase family 2 protein [Leptospiraceae bacterium]
MNDQKYPFSVSVLVPVYNEEKTIGIVLQKLLKLPFVKEIIVVNDCSNDNTEEVILGFLQKHQDKIIYQKNEKNSGKTASIRKAKALATGDIIIIQDADLEYDPDEIESVIEPIQKGVADVVYGSRFLVKKAARVLYYYHYIANKFLTHLSNLFTNLNMTDIETCYKAFRKEYFKDMPLTSKGFGMEVEITATIGKMPVRVYEVPISYYGRTYEEGKKIGFKDGLYAIFYIFYFNLFGMWNKERREFVKRFYKKKSDS